MFFLVHSFRKSLNWQLQGFFATHFTSTTNWMKNVVVNSILYSAAECRGIKVCDHEKWRCMKSSSAFRPNSSKFSWFSAASIWHVSTWSSSYALKAKLNEISSSYSSRLDLWLNVYTRGEKNTSTNIDDKEFEIIFS